jgi:hypothetical protein
MSEIVDGEQSKRVGQVERSEKQHAPWEVAVEIIEVIVLAFVAVATAWSGFQAGKWESRQSLFYGRAFTQRFQADTASTFGSQELAANSAIFTAWLQAHAEGNAQLQSQYAARFTSDYKQAFNAWLATHPFTNPNAPSGPAAMPQYSNSYISEATRLNDQASLTFDQGTSARDTSDEYLRYTVLLASILFLIALAQRLKDRVARIGLNVVAIGVLIYALSEVLTLPRL